MRNEMGNSNTSGILEEEGAAVAADTKAPQQVQESVESSLNNSSSSANDDDHNVEKSEAEDSTTESSKVQTIDNPINEENNTHSEIKTGEAENIDLNPSPIKGEDFAEVNDSSNDDNGNENDNDNDAAAADDDDEEKQRMNIEVEQNGVTVDSGNDVENAEMENNGVIMKETDSLQDKAIEGGGVMNEDENGGNEDGTETTNALDCTDADSNPIVKCTMESSNGTENESKNNKDDEEEKNLTENEALGASRPERAEPPEKIPEHETDRIISPLPMIRSKVQETARRYSVDYSSEQPTSQMESRRAPSFDFGVPLDARSSESDQTPLLRPEKPPPVATRRLSVDFQSTVFGLGDSMDYDTMVVAEKTIRMERSGSDVPFLITIKKDENGKLAEETAESFVADMEGNAEDNMFKNASAAANGLALASTKGGSGKRKPLPSFFSTCICCIASSN